jgi:hypothetical protein
MYEVECVVLCCGVYDVYIVSLPLALGFGERGVGFNEMVVCRLVFDWNTIFYITLHMKKASS